MMRQKFAITASVSCLALLTVGFVLDRLRFESTSPLFAAFMTTSLLGTMLGSVPHWSRIANARSRTIYAICLYIGWRFAYFPIMVIAGTGAAYAEAAALTVGFPALIYAPFLLLMATLHATVAAVAAWAVVTSSSLKHSDFGISGATAGLPSSVVQQIGHRTAGQASSGTLFQRAAKSLRNGTLIALMIAPAVAVSISKTEDLHPLPDRCWHTIPDHLSARKPVSNPYLTALDQPEVRLQQRLLLFAAGSTYDLIPNSPWSNSVKGTLESLFISNPLGSTADRIEEHYLGYLAAHSHINETDGQD